MNNEREKRMLEAAGNLALVVLKGFDGEVASEAEHAAWDYLINTDSGAHIEQACRQIAAVLLGCAPEALVTEDDGESYHCNGNFAVDCTADWPKTVKRDDSEEVSAAEIERQSDGTDERYRSY